MKVHVRGLNSCVNRKRDIKRYKEYILRNGHNLVESVEESDMVLLWTCSFRQDMNDNSIETIKEINALDSELVVCGCLPDIDQKGLEKIFDGKYFRWREEETHMPKIFGIKGDLNNPNEYLGERCVKTDIQTLTKTNPDFKFTFTDQFIKLFVSEGCKHKCTYCAEILAFPPYRSFPINSLVEKCKILKKETGSNKVVLWADSLGDYGKDCNTTLPQLITQLLCDIPNIKVGLEHLHPANFMEYFDELMNFVQNEDIWLIDTPIQSASSKILKMMNREYRKPDLKKIFSSLQDANFRELQTHVIIGFPLESEEDFFETVDFIIKYKPKYVLLSGYMEANGAPSSSIKGKISSEEIRRRVIYAAEHISEHGIICNYDNSSLIQDRFAKQLFDLS